MQRYTSMQSWGLIGGAILCLVLCTNEAAGRELQSLPLRHFEIHEFDDGTINVEARCVPVAEVLTSLAALTGKPLTFETQVRTHVSLWAPWRRASAAAWLDSTASLGGYLQCIEDQDGWRIRPPVHPSLYDPSLTDVEVASLYRRSLVPQTPVAGTRGAVLFLAGTYLPAPYQITSRTDGEGRTEILVNGLHARRLGSDAPIPATDAMPPDTGLPENLQFSDYHMLFKYIRVTLYPELIPKEGPEGAMNIVRTFLASQEIVENVDIYPNSRNLYVRCAGEQLAHSVFPENYDYETGETTPTKARWRPSLPEKESGQLTRAVSSLESLLSHPCVAILTKGGASVVFSEPSQVQQFLDVIAAFSGRSLSETECLLAEIVEDRRTARELAANTATRREQALNAVQGLLDVLAQRRAEPTPSAELDDAVLHLLETGL